MLKKKPSSNSSPPKSKQPLSTGNLTPSLNESNDNRLKRNANGGILVTTEEIRNAFEFLDVDQSGKISLANLKSKLVFFTFQCLIPCKNSHIIDLMLLLQLPYLDFMPA